MISVFLGWYLKITFSYLKSAPLKFSNCEILPENKKCLNFGPNTLYLSIFRLQFENNIVIFEISTLQFVYFENFVEKWKCLNLRPTTPFLGIFGLEFLGIFVWNFGLKSAPWNLSNREISWNNENSYIWD